jgi:hypothetical protein
LRIFVLDTYYPAFLDAHYRQRPGLASRDYQEQLRALLDRFFGTSDAYSHYLRKLGHEAVEIVANCEPLQLRWAAEHGLSVPRLGRLPGPRGRRARLASIAAAQIEEFSPDVVYVQDLWFLTPRALDEIRGRGVFLAGQIASAPPPDRLLRRFDLITTSFPHYVERFHRLGVQSEYLKLAFDDRLRNVLAGRGTSITPDAERPHAVTFVGGVNPKVHPERITVLERVAREVELEVWGYGANALPKRSILRRCHRGEAWAIGMYEVLARSRITLNVHIEAAETYANNMRLYEGTGTGALLLTDRKQNLGDLFEVGREVVAYDDADDLVEKIRHYLDDDRARAEIAAAGQARTLREHTYQRRVGELVDLLASAAGATPTRIGSGG